MNEGLDDVVQQLPHERRIGCICDNSCASLLFDAIEERSCQQTDDHSDHIAHKP